MGKRKVPEVRVRFSLGDRPAPKPDANGDVPLPPEAIRFIAALARYCRKQYDLDPDWADKLTLEDWRKRPRKRVLKPKEPKSKNGA